MMLGKILFLFGVLYKVLPPIWKGGKWWFVTMEKNYDPRRPKPWKLHNRMSGWTGVVVTIAYSGVLWNAAQRETGFFQLYFACGTLLMLLSAGAFAFGQNRVWKRGDYFLRPVKVGPLEGVF